MYKSYFKFSISLISILIISYIVILKCTQNNLINIKTRILIIDYRFFILDIPLTLLFISALLIFLTKRISKYIYVILYIIFAYLLIYLTFGKFNPY
jgi:hypothetical protein